MPVKIESLMPYRARVVITEQGYLETPRQWIAGYRASVDGRMVTPERLKTGMLGVPLELGTHSVELDFVGSTRLWIGLIVSATTWLIVLLWSLAGGWAGLLAWKEILTGGFRRWAEVSKT